MPAPAAPVPAAASPAAAEPPPSGGPTKEPTPPPAAPEASVARVDRLKPEPPGRPAAGALPHSAGATPPTAQASVPLTSRWTLYADRAERAPDLPREPSRSAGSSPPPTAATLGPTRSADESTRGSTAAASEDATPSLPRAAAPGDEASSPGPEGAGRGAGGDRPASAKPEVANGDARPAAVTSGSGSSGSLVGSRSAGSTPTLGSLDGQAIKYRDFRLDDAAAAAGGGTSQSAGATPRLPAADVAAIRYRDFRLDDAEAATAAAAAAPTKPPAAAAESVHFVAPIRFRDFRLDEAAQANKEQPPGAAAEASPRDKPATDASAPPAAWPALSSSAGGSPRPTPGSGMPAREVAWGAGRPGESPPPAARRAPEAASPPVAAAGRTMVPLRGPVHAPLPAASVRVGPLVPPATAAPAPPTSTGQAPEGREAAGGPDGSSALTTSNADTDADANADADAAQPSAPASAPAPAPAPAPEPLPAAASPKRVIAPPPPPAVPPDHHPLQNRWVFFHMRKTSASAQLSVAFRQYQKEYMSFGACASVCPASAVVLSNGIVQRLMRRMAPPHLRGIPGQVEEFWGILDNILPVSRIASGTNLYMFKRGIEPAWEDPINRMVRPRLASGRHSESDTNQQRVDADTIRCHSAGRRVCIFLARPHAL